MKTKLFTTFVVLSAFVFMAGCTESYSDSGTHLYHHYQPSTGQALQSLGELTYQLRGKKKGVTPQEYNDGMRSLGALGTLIDFTK